MTDPRDELRATLGATIQRLYLAARAAAGEAKSRAATYPLSPAAALSPIEKELAEAVRQASRWLDSVIHALDGNGNGRVYDVHDAPSESGS